MMADPKSTQYVNVEVLINAPPEVVWEVLTNFQDWPSWNPEVKKVRGDMTVAKGSVFKWVGGGAKIRSTIEEVDRPNHIIWSGRVMSIKAVHVWRLTPRGSRTLVRTEESWNGLLAKMFKKMLQRQLEESTSSGLKSLKSEAERRAKQE